MAGPLPPIPIGGKQFCKFDLFFSRRKIPAVTPATLLRREPTLASSRFRVSSASTSRIQLSLSLCGGMFFFWYDFFKFEPSLFDKKKRVFLEKFVHHNSLFLF